MPRIIEYEDSPDLQTMIVGMVTNTSYAEFAPLREHEVRITSCFKCAYKEQSEDADPQTAISGPHPAKLQQFKGPIKLQVSSDYCVVMDYCFWLNAPQNKKVAAVHHALMQIEVRTKRETVELKTRRPDVVEFSHTITRFANDVDSISGLLPVLMQAGERFRAQISSNQQTA